MHVCVGTSLYKAVCIMQVYVIQLTVPAYSKSHVILSDVQCHALSQEKGKVNVVTVAFRKKTHLETFVYMCVWECSLSACAVFKTLMSNQSVFSSPLTRTHFPTW